jgi:hypothetical protein
VALDPAGGVAQAQAVDPAAVADPIGGAAGHPAVDADQPASPVSPLTGPRVLTLVGLSEAKATRVWSSVRPATTNGWAGRSRAGRTRHRADHAC